MTMSIGNELDRVLVTGGTGFVGRHLCRRLVNEGLEVHAIVRPTSNRSTLAPGVIVHEIADATASITTIAKSVLPSHVFHLATYFCGSREPTAIHRMVESNVAFGTAVADAAVQVGAGFIHATSSWQHHGGAEYSPVSLYAATKQALSSIVRYFSEAEGLAACEVCLFDTYGPDDGRRKVLSLLLEHAESGAPLDLSSGRQLIDLTHIDDVVEGFLLARELCSPVGPRLVLRSGHPITVRALGRLVEEITGRRIAARWGARPERPREMYEDWTIPGMSSPWQPTIRLDSGIAALWNDRDESSATA